MSDPMLKLAVPPDVVPTDYQSSWSHVAGVQLHRLMGEKNISVMRMAERLGVSRARLTKILKGNSSDINLAASCMVSLTGQVHGLFDLAQIPPIVNHTGVARIDEMLADLYDDLSKSGLRGLGEYVTADYRCCHRDYQIYKPPTSPMQRLMNEHLEYCTTVADDGIAMMGIDFETEEKLARQKAEEDLVTVRIKRVINADIISPTAISVEFTKLTEVHDELIKRSSHRYIDRYELTNTIEQIQNGHALRIRRKTWQLSTSVKMVTH